MANTKSKKAPARRSSKPKTAAKQPARAAHAEVKTEKVGTIASGASKKPFDGFFARKFDANENILTIFKSPKIWGALLGEVAGTMLLTFFILSLGFMGQTGYQTAILLFGYIVITIAVYGLSGANLNPAITVGMMASRRMSAIRGVLYIVAQVVGAWLGLVLMNAFQGAGGEAAADLPVMAAVEDGMFWPTTMVEFFGVIVFAFFFARAMQYRRSVFTFAAVVGGGFTVAALFALVLMNAFYGTANGFMLNPAVSIMYQIFPTTGESFGELLGSISLAAVTYIIFPMIGAVIGFYLSDIAGRLTGEEAK